MTFGIIEDGPPDGPLALLVHGFPDTAHTWRHLLPDLAARDFHAVAPFLRGYAPTSLAPDGNYSIGALAHDCCELYEALRATAPALLIGHDWGAIAAYGAANCKPEYWGRLVTMAVPPLTGILSRFTRFAQLKRSWYMFFFLHPLAAQIVTSDDRAILAGLWSDWSPGYDSSEDLAHVRDALPTQERMQAAISYYRSLLDPSSVDPSFAAEYAAAFAPVAQPTLYLHGELDGCIGVEAAEGATASLGKGSRAVVVPGAGHFLHLERPQEIAGEIGRFLSSPSQPIDAA